MNIVLNADVPTGDTRRAVFERIEKICNQTRKHTSNGMLSPVDLEIRQNKLTRTGVWETSGT